MSNPRYIRQTLLDRIGENGQKRLSQSKVAIIGCGGLGSIAAPYLAGAGIGHIVLIDGDRPDISNLHRQVFFSEVKTNLTKSEVLANHICQLNSDVKITTITDMINKENIETHLTDVNLVLECTDNINTKYLVNDYCQISRIPMVYGAIHKYDGFLSFFENRDETSIHLRDIFPIPNTDIPSCSQVGVLGTIAGIIGLMQANETIKYITQTGECMIGRLLSYDVLTNDQMKLKLKKSYSEDLRVVYHRSSYTESFGCVINEITLEEVKRSRSSYELISILPDGEHRSIDDHVIRMSLDSIDAETWQPISDKPHVFYCISGKRSSDLVRKMAASNSKFEVYSLEGGLNGVD